MIGSIEGVVVEKDERALVVSVGGLGYLVAALPSTLVAAEVGTTVRLFTHLAVREDALDLYGFAAKNELALFRLLIGVSGIGPKSAMNVLALADAGVLVRAISGGDSAYLTKVSGIGKKLAEKIVLELKEKVGGLGVTENIPKAEGEALDALEALGYPVRDTRELVRTLSKKHDSAEAIIRAALQALGKR